MTSDRDALRDDPIRSLVEMGRSLNSISDGKFPREWLLRALKTEFHRYTMEDDYIDPDSPEVDEAGAAFNALMESDDWIHPKLGTYLHACRKVATLKPLNWVELDAVVETAQRQFAMTWSSAQDKPEIVVSDRRARNVPIIEKNLGDPRYCRGVVDAFAANIGRMKRAFGIDRLLFIEKEVGPVGALSMMSSIVDATGLPASIYRESHWSERAAFAAGIPEPPNRIAIIYDLIVTGTGIMSAADAVKEMTGARTFAAVVLCGFGEQRDELHSRAGQSISVGALSWLDENAAVPKGLISRERGEVRNGSALRQPSREESPVSARKSESRGNYIPPGSYTAESLPPLSSEAKRILSVVKAHAASAGKRKVVDGSRKSKSVALGVPINRFRGEGVPVKSGLKPSGKTKK